MISVATHEAQTPSAAVSTAAPPSETSSPAKPSQQPTIFRSRLPDIPISNHLSLHRYCFERAAELADSPCIIAGATGRVYTYSETLLLCRRAAAGFSSKLGVKPNDVVFLLLPNSPEFVFSFFAASMLGAATTAANPFYTSAEILKQMKSAGAKVIVTQSVHVGKLRADGFPNDMQIVTVDSPPDDHCTSFGDLLNEEPLADYDEPEIDPMAAVAVPYSSGTTGLPKGVVLTHRSLISSVAQQVDGENPNLSINEEDVMLCVLPLFHIFSLNSVLLCGLRAGSAVVIMAKFDITAMLELIARYRVTVAAVVPPLVLAMAKSSDVEKYDLSSIKKVLCGAAPLGKELQEALLRRLPQAVFGQGYGMTEAGPVLSMCPGFAKYPTEAKPGSCGTVVRNADLKVIDPENGLSLGRNQPGEICIRGPQIMKGYLNDPEATANTIDTDGWLHTGDIGYVDDDDEVFIVDRVKELIKYKGFQVPPAELEALLVSHPSIADAAVVPQKDVAAGEVPVAFVVPSQGCDLTEDTVKEFIAKQVVFYKKLHKVYFVDSIPKSASGKILRKDLRARLASSS